MSKSVRYNEVSFYRGSFSYILLLLGQKISFVTPRTSLYRGSLNRGFTVLRFSPDENNAVIEVGYQGNLSPDRKMIKLLRLLTFDEFVSVTTTFS